jgi:hypothetical protein
MKECCQQPEHRERLESPRPDIVVERCRVCGCTHREATIDPMTLTTITPAGG